jgi:seryl-tRNA synthetase
VRDEVMFGTAQLPKFEEDQFKQACLIGSCEMRLEENRIAYSKHEPTF